MICTDCLINESSISCKKIDDGLCTSCRRRKARMGFNYVPIKDLEEKEKIRKTNIEEIEEEVENVLEECYTEHNCNIRSEIHIDDILAALNILKELFNQKELMTEMKNKLDIIEKYRRDINHEGELENIENNDELAIYISRKQHVLDKKFRRKIKDKLEIYEIVDPLINKMKSGKQINTEQIDSVIKKITERVETQSKRNYVPYVDKSMIDKYSWCTHGSGSGKFVTKKKAVEYKVTFTVTNLNKKIFNQEREVIVTAFSEEQAIMSAKNIVGLNKTLFKSHNIYSNFKAERCKID